MNGTKSRRILPSVLLMVFAFVFIWIMANLIMETLNYNNNGAALLLAGTISLLMGAGTFRKKRDFHDVEHGSASWARSKDIKPFVNRDFQKNIILSQTERLSLDMFVTHRDCHVFVVGGSGSGKSRYYVQPNLMQMNASYVVVDPTGSQIEECGKMLEQNGYKIKLFDIVTLTGGLHFNPFLYFYETKDIKRFINILMSNTSGGADNAHMNEDFWVKSERLWLMAHISYIMETCLPEEKNIPSLMLLLNGSEARDEDESFKSAVDILFEDLAKENPESFAVKQYTKFKLAAGKTAKSILVSVGVRLADFDIPEISRMFRSDELELGKLGKEKTALFLKVPDMDTTYNYLVAILLDVLFNVCEHEALQCPGKHLPIMVRCLLDEIANIGRFPNLHVTTSVIRKYWVTLEFLWQNLNQAKALYKDNWATIEGNCDTTLFLGGKGEDTTKYVSNDLLGKATIDTVSYGSSGSSGSLGRNNYNQNEQKAGRNLLDETEVSRLSDDDCIVSIRGVKPFKSRKYNPKKHPNYKLLGSEKSDNLYRFLRTADIQKGDGIPYITETQILEVS